MIQQSFKANPIIENARWQLEIESNCVRIISQTVNFGQLLWDWIYLDVLSFLLLPSPEIILEHFCSNYLEVYGYSFVESLHNEKIILKVVVAIVAWFISRNRAVILLLLYE